MVLVSYLSDGRPAHKATVRCKGEWYKMVDRNKDGTYPFIGGVEYPFPTDSRGAAPFNPTLDMEWIKCTAEKDGLVGTNGIWIEDVDRAFLEIYLKEPDANQ